MILDITRHFLIIETSTLFVFFTESNFLSLCNNTFSIYEVLFWNFLFPNANTFFDCYSFFVYSCCIFRFGSFCCFFSFCFSCKNGVNKLWVAFYFSQRCMCSFLLGFFFRISFACTCRNIFYGNLRFKNRILITVE